MERAGQQRTVRAEDVAHMGITEVLRHAPFIYAQYRKLVRVIQQQKPDIAVLIDFPDVNFRLAKHLAHAGVPVIWFVGPQLWAWKRSRLRWVQERVSKMLVIFPFEEHFYRERGVDAEFVGHPLAAQTHNPLPREAYAEQHHLDPARTWIALLPGSRWKEIRANLPALHELAMSDLIGSAAAHTIFDATGLHQPIDPAAHTHFEFLLPVASTIDPVELHRFIDTLNAEHLKYFGPEAASLRLTLVPDAREALAQARASVVASGTATVLAAIAGNPFVVVYRVSALTFALARKLVRYPDEFRAKPDRAGNLPISMVNLIAQYRLIPELLQERFTAANVATALSPLLTDSAERDRQISGLASVRQQLSVGGPIGWANKVDPIDRVAETVLRLLSTHGVA
jgi:lipid-A-disaccharide synthase